MTPPVCISTTEKKITSPFLSGGGHICQTVDTNQAIRITARLNVWDKNSVWLCLRPLLLQHDNPTKMSHFVPLSNEQVQASRSDQHPSQSTLLFLPPGLDPGFSQQWSSSKKKPGVPCPS